MLYDAYKAHLESLISLNIHLKEAAYYVRTYLTQTAPNGAQSDRLG
jgi:hypothetical protein